jgi:hypothetical protein
MSGVRLHRPELRFIECLLAAEKDDLRAHENSPDFTVVPETAKFQKARACFLKD